MRIAIGSDHRGVAARLRLIGLLERIGHEVVDCGSHGPDAVDYPDIAADVAHRVSEGTVDRGVLLCCTGVGMAIAANKIRGARATMCTNVTLARYSREHNGANVLALGSTLIDTAEARDIVEMFLTTPTREPRYLRRLLKVRRLEESF